MSFTLKLYCPLCQSDNVVHGAEPKSHPDDIIPVCARCGHTLTNEEISKQVEIAAAKKLDDLLDQ